MKNNNRPPFLWDKKIIALAKKVGKIVRAAEKRNPDVYKRT